MNSLTQKLGFDLLVEINRLEIIFDYEVKELVPIGLNELLTINIKTND